MHQIVFDVSRLWNVSSCFAFYAFSFTGYGCMKVRVDVYTYNHSGPIANDTILWKSEREHVLNKYEPKVSPGSSDLCIQNNSVQTQMNNESRVLD